MKKILLFSSVLFCAFFLSVTAQAQVVGFVLNPQPIRGNYDIGIPASGWGISLDTVVATGRLVIGRSAGGAAAGDSLACDTTLVNASAIAGNIGSQLASATPVQRPPRSPRPETPAVTRRPELPRGE